MSLAVVFPQDLIEKGLAANNFAMLGLGDIVIPGIFIALLLRFDMRLIKILHLFIFYWFFFLSARNVVKGFEFCSCWEIHNSLFEYEILDSVHQNKRTYFYSGFAAYFLGLVLTIFVMHYFKHAQVGVD